MLDIQKYLKNNSISDLEKEFFIYATPHKTFPNLILFKYDQKDSDFSLEITKECRGIILDKDNDWSVVSRSLDKFFNFGESNQATIDWDNCHVLEKLDGSILTLYPYNGEWHVSTSGSPDASGSVNMLNMTFAQLFWQIFNSKQEVLPPVDCNKAFMFELTSQYNRVVVIYNEPDLTLIGARDLTSGREITTQKAIKYFTKIKEVKSHNFNNIKDIVESFPFSNPLEQEGYIVLDHNFNRIKVKNPAYISLHHLKSGLSSVRNIVELVVAGDIEEIILGAPEYSSVFRKVESALNALISETENKYKEIKDIKSQKEFASFAVLEKCPSALFSIRSGKTNSISHFIKSLQTDTLIKLLDIQNIKIENESI